MRRITKGTEPEEWTVYRQTPGVAFNGIRPLRQALWEEQGHLCAYCMKELTLSDGMRSEQTHIEHIRSREWCKKHDQPELIFDYSNLVLCCSGQDREPTKDDKVMATYICCDRAKENACLSFDILGEAFEETLFYDIKTGTLQSTDEAINHDIFQTLNLNNPYLSRNRLATLMTWIEYSDSLPDFSPQEELLYWDSPGTDGALPAYCGIVTWFIKNHLLPGRSGR